MLHMVYCKDKCKNAFHMHSVCGTINLSSSQFIGLGSDSLGRGQFRPLRFLRCLCNRIIIEHTNLAERRNAFKFFLSESQS